MENQSYIEILQKYNNMIVWEKNNVPANCRGDDYQASMRP